MNMRKLEPIHPGEILLEEFLLPMNISQPRLADDTKISVEEITAIIEGTGPITPNAALRLSLYFGLSERYWLNLQSRYDLETEKERVADNLRKEVRVLQAA
ncbi:MAG: HigA family addiction module antidote protein [Saprospiraceae bacterium]|nr:HigA family addiction module antidote protein [Pyrinomonadaceae bacterium]